MMAWGQRLVLASAGTVRRLTAEDSVKSSSEERTGAVAGLTMQFIHHGTNCAG